MVAEVAVIGAGAAGLVATRHLLSHGLRPCVFEAAAKIGGAWSSSNPSTNKDADVGVHHQTHTKMWNGLLTTNLSKTTCRFSDWPWPEDSPTFPTASDMGNYLESYAANFIDPKSIHYLCRVTNVELEQSSPTTTATMNPGADVDMLIMGGSNQYRVEWTDMATSKKHSKSFDGVIVATGFFSKPNWPSGIVPDLSSSSSSTSYLNAEKKDRNLLHSSEYDSTSSDFEHQTVVVVGASFSALEIAADVSQKRAKKVINVLPRVPWVMPRFVPFRNKAISSESESSIVLPIDLAFYRRARKGLSQSELKYMSPTESRARHEFLNSIVGERQRQTPLGVPKKWDEELPFVAISDSYLDFVKQGDIEIIQGRFRGMTDTISSKQSSTTSVQVEVEESCTGERLVFEDVDQVILCTGYLPDLEAFLHQEILDVLEYDATDLFCPMTTCWDTLHPSLPNLFFCGMYRGAYMGIMELQARLAAGILSEEVHLDKPQLESALSISRQVRSQLPRAQFPHFDYIGYMDTLSTLLKKDFPKFGIEKGDIVSPAFYQCNEDLAQREMYELKKEVAKGRDGSRIPALVLSALIGEWNFDRSIVHFNDGNRGEHVYGTVRFSRHASETVVYREDGFYELSPTKTLPVFREYEYQVAGDCVEIYFVERGERANIFLSLRFATHDGGDYWVATADHLCIKDLYSATFEIRLLGTHAEELTMTYRVKGPNKDYESATLLTSKGI